jgi:hypothetical protein
MINDKLDTAKFNGEFFIYLIQPPVLAINPGLSFSFTATHFSCTSQKLNYLQDSLWSLLSTCTFALVISPCSMDLSAIFTRKTQTSIYTTLFPVDSHTEIATGN